MNARTAGAIALTLIALAGAGAGVYLVVTSSGAAADNRVAHVNAVPAPPPLDSNATGNNSSDATSNNTAATGNRNTPPPASAAMPPLVPKLSNADGSKVTELGYHLYDEATAPDAMEGLMQLDCRAVPDLHRVPYRSLEHQQRLNNALRVLGDTPYRESSMVYLPHVAIDLATQRVIVEAHALKPDRQLEFLICTERGHAHESLFRLDASARHLAMALLAAGNKPCSPDNRPVFDGDWMPWDGGGLIITVQWMVGETRVEHRIEKLIVAGPDGANVPDTGWVFVGSPAAGQGEAMLSDAMGPVAALHSRPAAIITNPWPDARIDGHFRQTDLHPAADTPVRIIFMPEPETMRAERVASLQAEWQRCRDERQSHAAGMTRLVDSITADDVALIAQPGTGGGGQQSQDRFALPALLPALTAEERARFAALVGQLAGDEAQRAEALTALNALDSRYEDLAEQAWRDLRSDPVRSELIARVIDRLVQERFRGPDDSTCYNGLVIDKKRNIIIADAMVASYENMPLEFLICRPRGKGHESLFVMKGYARNFEAGIVELGWKPSSQHPAFPGDWRLYDGDTVVIEAAWKTDPAATAPDPMAGPEAWANQPGLKVMRVEQMVIDRHTRRSLPPTGFAYTGSYTAEQNGREVFVADEVGAVVGTQTMHQTVLENPWPHAGEDHSYLADREKTPPAGRQVRLYFRLETAAERAVRQPELEAAWEGERLKRPAMHFNPPDGWSKIGTRTDFVFVNKDNASLAVMVEAKGTADKSITEGYKTFVFEKTEFDPDFREDEDTHKKGRFVGPYEPADPAHPDAEARDKARVENVRGVDVMHGIHPAWKFMWIDKENQPVFRMVVITSRFYYHVFFFWPGRTDVDALEQVFSDLVSKLELGHKENQVETGEGWTSKKKLEPEHEQLLGSWKVDVAATVRLAPANAGKSAAELNSLVQTATAELGKAVVEVSDDRIDVFIPGQQPGQYTYAFNKAGEGFVDIDLIDRRGHLMETRLVNTEGKLRGTFDQRFLVLRRAD
ncbi:MAG: YdjY domain-containing protein [Planctomycetota bacterium]